MIEHKDQITGVPVKQTSVMFNFNSNMKTQAHIDNTSSMLEQDDLIVNIIMIITNKTHLKLTSAAVHFIRLDNNPPKGKFRCYSNTSVFPDKTRHIKSKQDKLLYSQDLSM